MRGLAQLNLHSIPVVFAKYRQMNVWFIEGLYEAGALIVVILFSSYIAWDDWRVWHFNPSLPLIILMFTTLLAGKCLIAGRPNRDAAARAGLSILWVLIVYTAVASWLLLSRTYYARAFLLLSLVLISAWQVIDSYILSKKRTPLRLAIVPFGETNEIPGVPGIDMYVMDKPVAPQSVDGILVDMHTSLPAPWKKFVVESSASGVPILHVASVDEFATSQVSLEYANDGWLREFLAGFQHYLPLKRALDLFVSIGSLPVVLPLCLIVGLAVKLDSKGPILFRQERVGKGGRRFFIVKFRSMNIDAEKHGAKFATADDDRITRVGRVIRRFRLDELPQIWNVLKGEMSIIGPRPEQVRFVDQFDQQIPLYHWRHQVKPGITGWAQINQGYAAGLDDAREKLKYDLYYVKHLSFRLDLLIIFQTLRILVTGYGAR